MDHLEGANYRDYSIAPKRGRRNEVVSGEEEQKEPLAAPEQAENTAQSSELMAETLKRLYEEQEDAGRKAEEKAAETVEAAAEQAEKAADSGESTETPADGETGAPAVQSAREASRRRRAEK